MGIEAPDTASTGLTFDAEKHQYRIDGQRVPSVTQVLQGAGLIDTTWFNDAARTRGTYVAQATEMYDKGTLDYDALDEGLKPYVMAWEKFLVASGAEIEVIERAVFSAVRRYAGTLDRIIRLGSHGFRQIIDIKTGSKAPWHCLQTMGYALCEHGFLRRASVILRDDGTYLFCEHNDDATDRHVFLSALNLYHWKSDKGLLK